MFSKDKNSQTEALEVKKSLPVKLTEKYSKETRQKIGEAITRMAGLGAAGMAVEGISSAAQNPTPFNLIKAGFELLGGMYLFRAGYVIAAEINGVKIDFHNGPRKEK